MTALKLLLRRFFGAPAPSAPPTELDRARQLIAAIDQGGIPLNPQTVRRIAESFGLEVSRQEHTKVTVERIRAALKRIDQA